VTISSFGPSTTREDLLHTGSERSSQPAAMPVKKQAASAATGTRTRFVI